MSKNKEHDTTGKLMINFRNYGTNIIFDCDDVLLDWTSSFRLWMSREYNRDLNPVGPNSWNMDEWVGSPALPFIKKFNSSPSFAELRPCMGANQAVSALYASGHNLHVITACSNDPITISRRELNLDRVFGDVFTSIVCVPLGATKTDALMSLDKGVYIEDNVDHALTGLDFGHKTFVMRRHHNFSSENSTCNRPDLHWVDDFRPIVREFAGLHDVMNF